MKLQTINESRRPKVGVFWFDGDKLIDFGWDASEIPMAGQVRDSPKDHIDIWDTLNKGDDYLSLPRGRVTAIGATYYIRSSREILNDKNKVGKIMRAYSLPPNAVVLEQDYHYEQSPPELEDLD